MKFKYLLMPALLLSLTSCESDEQNAINAAQICLNNATAATAGNCKNIVAGHTSTDSYAIRCSADFLAQGLTATQIATALERRDVTGTTGNSLLGMMGVMTFDSATAISTAVTDCNLSAVTGFIMVSQMAKVATDMALAAGSGVTVTASTKPTQAEMEAALTNFVATANDDSKTSVGAAASTVYTDYCASGTNTSKVCTTIGTAITTAGGATATSLAIGNQLLAQLQSN